MSVLKRKVIWFAFITAILIIAVFGIYQATHINKFHEVARTLQNLTVIKPKSQNATITHRYIGQVEAINQTDIVPYINGYITEITAQGGQAVRKGDVLAILKQDDYVAKLAAADAELFALKADFFNSKIKYERMKKSGENVYSPQELDDAKSAFLSAAGNLEQAQANRYAASINLDYTYLKAPFDGVLGNIAASIGEYVSPQSEKLMELVQYDPIRVVFSVTDKEFLNHFDKKDDKNLIMKVQLANGDILPQPGEIKYTANSIDKNTNSLAVYAEFSNPDNRLIPNAYVEVLLERRYKNVVLIDKSLLIMKTDGDYVYTVLNGVLNMHKLHIYGEDNNFIVAEDNFSPEEYIITETVENLLVGEEVPYEVINKTEQ
ncbi:MAG: efflux RND transporter periplasmic adaptor subunit [Alphaproteobacteria bacterium]|nr:efflux RND transporter periplasmic adaptor subunit [Alphaproteobacteria bacterium]